MSDVYVYVELYPASGIFTTSGLVATWQSIQASLTYAILLERRVLVRQPLIHVLWHTRQNCR